MDDLRNITMKNVEIVEAFGLIRSTEKRPDAGFDRDQLKLLAKKIRHEWHGKEPETYSEYDLKAMGEILCYLNASDINDIHPIAFKCVFLFGFLIPFIFIIIINYYQSI